MACAGSSQRLALGRMNAAGHPILLLEINTRCWLRELSVAAGQPLDLARVPDAMLTEWTRLGFTHIWLMGVWRTGPRSRAAYLHHPDTGRRLAEILPDWTDVDVSGSPYAIAAYHVAEALGGDAGLAAFRAQLHRHGLRLVLDFVPNHTGLDHSWLEEHAGIYVPGRLELSGSFLRETRDGPRWFTHGKDPCFAPWIDTAQLDFRRADTRAALRDTLRSVAARCDGVRCDMAMLVLNDIFAATWKEHPPIRDESGEEFWAEAIRTVKAEQGAEFQFIAEAYWDLEPRLQALGFDFTYHKRVLDHLVAREPRAMGETLAKHGPDFLARSLHFLENHDEARIASRLSLAEHRAAALLTLTLPGMPLLQDGQLSGALLHTPVQLARRPVEPPSREIEAMYATLLAARRASLVGHGTPELHAWEDGVITIRWSGEGRKDVAVINLSGEPRRAQLAVPPRGAGWKYFDHLAEGAGTQTWLSPHTHALDLDSHAAHWYRFLPRD
jgi:Alpha amylase, catalytic domain